MNFSFKNSVTVRPSILLTAIFILGLWLRMHKLDFQSFWGDEYINIVLAQSNQIWRDCLLNIIPPLYILLLAGWIKIFSLSESTVRLLGALIGSFSIIPFYFLGKRLFNKNVGLLAGLFLSISSLHIDYCQEAKYYPLVFLMAILTNLAYVDIWREPKLKYFACYILFFTAGLYTHYYFGVFFVIHLLHLFFNRRNNLLRISKILYAQAVIALLFLPIILYTLFNLKHIAGSTAWIPAPTIHSISSTLGLMLGGTHLVSGDFSLVRQIFLCILVAFFFFSYRFWYRQWRNSRPAVSLILLWIAVPFLGFYTVSIVLLPLYHTRYVLVSMLGLYLFLAWIIESSPPPLSIRALPDCMTALSQKPREGIKQVASVTLRATLLVLMILSNVLSLRFYFQHPVRYQFRQAAEFLSENLKKGEKIIIRGYDAEGHLLKYYLERLELTNPVFVDERRKAPAPKGYGWVIDVFNDCDQSDYFSLAKEFFGIRVYRTKTPTTPR